MVRGITFAIAIATACGRPAAPGVEAPATKQAPAQPTAGPPAPAIVTVTVTPVTATVTTGSTQKLMASVANTTDATVLWSAPDGGTVDENGNYRAPALPGEYRVVATSRVEPKASATARIVVRPGPDDDVIDRGGEILPSTTTYAIYWGPPELFPPDEFSTVEGVLRGIQDSSLFASIDQYMRGGHADTNFAGSIYDPGSPPVNPPGPGEVAAEVCSVLDASGLTPSPDGVYFLYLSSSFLLGSSRDCAWHSFGACHGTRIQIALIPNPAQTACAFIPRHGCSQGSDLSQVLANLTAHELVEAITDPFGSAWGDFGGQEIAAKCIADRGCAAIGGVVYDLQQIWSNSAHSCVTP